MGDQQIYQRGRPNCAYLLLVLDLPPRQLPVDELHQHVEQRPQVVVPAHLPVPVRIDARIADGAAEAGGRARTAHLAGAGRVLTGQAEVQHVDAPTVVWQPADGEVALRGIGGIVSVCAWGIDLIRRTPCWRKGVLCSEYIKLSSNVKFLQYEFDFGRVICITTKILHNYMFNMYHCFCIGFNSI